MKRAQFVFIIVVVVADWFHRDVLPQLMWLPYAMREKIALAFRRGDTDVR